ncbi:hypothetical protein, partial [Sphingomonas sp. CFBP 13706]|uniref:hypothetical protein n=1 Tax=Sphingomonas sp. CFBP 13706 TaxID=2775314 RepID=UPI00178753BD
PPSTPFTDPRSIDPQLPPVSALIAQPLAMTAPTLKVRLVSAMLPDAQPAIADTARKARTARTAATS